MSEDKAWDTGHELSQEHQGQKHGILKEEIRWKQLNKVTPEVNI